MSKSVATVSNEAQEEAGTASVFDFLYHDSRRIGSFLSQFDANGLLTGITQNEGLTKGAKRSKRFGFGAQSPLGGGNLDFEIGPGESGSQSVARSYDPFWTNALEFLDVLDERDMICRDIESAAIGQFVLSSGYLNIQDLSMLKDAWKLPSIQKKARGGVSDNRKASNLTAAQRAEQREQQENIDLFFEMIQIMPHSVHARMLSKYKEKTRLIWSALDPNSLVSPASDIALTYGSMMSGEWSVLGILSAQPEFLTPDFTRQFDAEDFGLTESVVGQISSILAPVVRVSLGRPAAAFAVTPLMIFREVA